MLLTINKKATEEEIKKMAEDWDGFIKVVIDIKQEILAGGGKRHVEGEQSFWVRVQNSKTFGEEE